MSDHHAFFVLDTQGHIGVLTKALKDFTQPFSVIHTEPPRAVYQLVQVRGHTVQQLAYQGGDTRVQLDGIPGPITPARCKAILKALLFEHLSQSVQYMETQSPNQSIACALFDVELPTAVQLDAVDLFLDHYRVDGLINDLIAMMDVVRVEPWRDWKLVESHGFFALIGGRDYRIEEWERMNPQYDQSTQDYQFDMNSLLNYVGTQFSAAHYAAAPTDAYIIRYIVASALSELIPTVAIKQTHCPTFGFASYPEFLQTIVKPAVRTFVLTTLKGVLSDGHTPSYHSHYEGQLLDNGVLVLERQATPIDVEENERLEILTAIANQDYVPERLRRKYAV